MEKKYIKIGMKYKRDYDIHPQFENVLLCCDKINRKNIQTEIKEYVKEWTGSGYLEILNISTGPFEGDLLSAKNESFFVGKKYKFKTIKK